MEVYIILMAFTITLLLAVVCGFAMGRMTRAEAPAKSPVKVIKDRKIAKADEKEMEKLTTIWENIENYDGTGAFQKDVPN